jgi:hypothetical protein
VLDFLFGGLEASPVAWTSLMETLYENYWNKKKYKFCSTCEILQFLVIKSLDCWIRIRNETNSDPQHHYSKQREVENGFSKFG